MPTTRMYVDILSNYTFFVDVLKGLEIADVMVISSY